MGKKNNPTINQHNMMHFRQMTRQTSLYYNWHKFIILGAAELDRETVLKTIVNATGDLFPIQYMVEGVNASFIAKHCLSAIDAIVNQNMTVFFPDGQPLVINIALNDGCPNMTTLKIQDVITLVLSQRFDRQTGCLNLNNLVKDPELADKVYCALSHSKIFTFILSLMRGFHVKSLKLSNNEITDIGGFVCKPWKHLTHIDLSNNLIEDISALQSLKSIALKEIQLEGNPICDSYNDLSYVIRLRELCPTIESIDGVQVGSGTPMFRRNFLVDIDSNDFVDQFLEHYFTLYDNQYRRCLADLYSSKAMFSLTCSYIPGQASSASAQLEDYRKYGRNLLSMSDYSKSEKLLYQGKESILNLLCELPQTEHDPYTFTVDLLHRAESIAVILVCGVFREVRIGKLNETRLYNFARTFILQRYPYGTNYNIINEQMHISNAVTIQAQRAFKNPKYVNPMTLEKPNFTTDEKACIVETFARISTLNLEHAQKFLESKDWNLKLALSVFVDQYKDERFGPEAFKIM